MNLSFQKIFFILATVFGIFAVLVFAKTILIPIGMALLISFILFPVSRKLESWGTNKIVGALLSILFLVLIIAGGLTLFSTQIIRLSDELSNFTDKITATFTDVILYINNNVQFLGDFNREELIEEGKGWLKDSSGALLRNTFSGTAAFLTGLVTTIIFTFLFLIYRVGLTQAFMRFASAENRQKVFHMLKNIQEVGKKYLSGMFTLILILGFANSIGLWIIGIDSPFLFGFLAALLSIIPYVGTTIGATIPVLYAFMSTDQLWVPLAVVGLFWFIQTIESNFLSPKIVGSSLNVNALAAILSLLIGGSVWGIAGMVLFLPFAAMLKVFCDEFEELRPVAMLIGSEVVGNDKDDKKSSKWIGKIKDWFSRK
ncbi:AI-2E family transporter [Marivirga sp. S37H4]|uniref:AI-2E family transporter n=1 Tax=Marivirga aurantiaca TaxID=2802615 RepID=A0A934WZX6_9BACT|nr:AI-2E family transporter [Marivirga aurantiaca]MBK6266313.1 AI-2E family transporter [Marivirga aurantiaca]